MAVAEGDIVGVGVASRDGAKLGEGEGIGVYVCDASGLAVLEAVADANASGIGVEV